MRKGATMMVRDPSTGEVLGYVPSRKVALKLARALEMAIDVETMGIMRGEVAEDERPTMRDVSGPSDRGRRT